MFRVIKYTDDTFIFEAYLYILSYMIIIDALLHVQDLIEGSLL